MRTQQEKDFLEIVRQYAGMGFGAMMQIVSREYYRQWGESAFASGPCICQLPPNEKAQYEAGYRADPLFPDGLQGLQTARGPKPAGWKPEAAQPKKPLRKHPTDALNDHN